MKMRHCSKANVKKTKRETHFIGFIQALLRNSIGKI